ncbi:MAG: hypothetical protein R2748_26980 [Bryobacterales bacterium]
MRLVLVGLVCLLVGLLAGWAPAYFKQAEFEKQAMATEEKLLGEISEVQQKLAISQIHSKLAILESQVRKGDFSLAQATSTKLYDQIDGALTAIPEGDDKRRLLTIKDTRDDVTAKLAVGDSSVLETIDRLFTLLSASL